MPETRLSFSKQNPNLQLAIDSTSLEALKRCPSYYELSILQGYRLKDDSPHLIFGTLFHLACEIYDLCISQNQTHDEAIVSVFEKIILKVWNPETQELEFRISNEPVKNLTTLLRTVLWYFDKYQNEHLETYILSSGKPATELSFRIILNDLVDDGSFTASTGEEFLLCGHLDKVVKFNNKLWDKDFKTSKNQLNDKYFKNFNPNNQMSVYDIAMQVIFHEDIEIGGILIDATQVQVLGNRFNRKQISRTPDQREEWLFDLKFWLHQLDYYAQINYWPRNDSACSMYGGCPFQMACSFGPNSRQQILDSFYEKREELWDPLKPR